MIKNLRILFYFILFCTFIPVLAVFFYPIEKMKTHYPLFDEYRILIGWSEEPPKDWIKLSQMSRGAYGPIIASEDGAFYQHDGVDMYELEQVVKQSWDKKKLIRGASTITMQLAKNLYLNKNRSLIRKLKEIILAKRMDDILKKRLILEYYLNIIEYGQDLYGIGNASRFYFKTHPRNLSYSQGAYLAYLLPNPKQHQKATKNGLTRYAQKRIKRILGRIR